MTIYEKNLKTLVKYYPEMDQEIEKAREHLVSELEVIEEESYDGEKILKVKKDGRCLYLNGCRNTREAARVWADTLGELAENSTIFLFGIGNYFYLKELVEKTKKRITIIVCEPSLQIFLKFLEQADVERWMEKHTILFWVYELEGMEEKELDSLLQRSIHYETMIHTRRFVLPNYEQLFQEEVLHFLKKYKEIAYEKMSNFHTNARFAHVAGKNVLANIRYLLDGYKTIQLVKVIPRDIPGIVVAAGPSLNKNIQELKKAKGKAFIIAVDTAIKPLLNAGIIPDMFAIVDGLKPLHLIEREEAKEIPLLTTVASASEILDYHTGMKFFFHEGFKEADAILARSEEPLCAMTIGGSVATLAFNLLYRIGLDRIILVGQDLAFTGNKSHADGTFQEKMKEEDTSGYIMVDGNVEEKVPTRPDFKMYLDWYNKFITNAKENRPNFHVINATEGGAKIEGTEIMTLKDAIERECTKEVDIQECLSHLSPMLDEEGRKWAVDYLKKMPQDFRNVETDAKKLLSLYQKLDKICDKKNIDRKEYLSILKKLEKAIKRIEKNNVYSIITDTMVEAHNILRQEEFLSENTMQAEGKEIARKGIIYANGVKTCASIFREYVAELYEGEL